MIDGLTRSVNNAKIMAFYTTDPNPVTVTVWGTIEACRAERPQRPVLSEREQPTEIEVRKLPPPLTRDERFEIQRRLTLAGYSTRGVDGVFGKGTRTAIANWQAASGFSSDGTLKVPQLRALRAQTEDAYRSFLRSGKAKGGELARRTNQKQAPTGRYIDDDGCMREATGQIVRGFKKKC